MHQNADMLTATITAIAGLVLGAAAVVTLMLARGDRPRTAVEPGPGPVVQGYRYCPAELRTRAAVLHPDGSATCGDCGTHIPAGDS